MNLNNTSIRSRFFILLVFTVLFWLLVGFIILSQIEKIGDYQDSSISIKSLQQQVLGLENSIRTFYNTDTKSSSFHESGRSEGISRFNSIYLDTYSLLKDLRDSPLLSNEIFIRQKLDRISEYLSTANDYKELIREKSRTRGWDVYGLSGNLLEQMEDMDSGLPAEIAQQSPGILNELRFYLVYPESSRLNSLLNNVNTIESSLPPSDPAGQNSGTLDIRGFLSNMRNLMTLDLELGLTRHEGLQSQIYSTLIVLMQEADALEGLWKIEREAKIRQIHWIIMIMILISAAIFGTLLFMFSKSIKRHLNDLRDSTLELMEGRFPEGIFHKGKTEFSEISSQLNLFIASLKNKTLFAARLAEGKETEPLEVLSRDDSLANSLINLEKSLLAAKTEEAKHQESREQRRWINEGVAKFGEILRIYNKDISSLGENVIRELVNYLEASAGGIFLLNTVNDESRFEMIASFAFDRKKYIRKSYSPGEGLVGTCAIEQEKIFLTEIPDDYINISSGFGESKPSCLLLVPLLLEDVTLGVIEIASLKRFALFEIEFVNNLAESIASAVSTVQMNMRTSQLLKQSQEQAREMAKQEEVMRQNMEELQTTQEESARRESEISGILNGIHNSAHVAEFNMEEELISINDKFLQLLESQRTQILGKKYHEIIGVSRHTDSFKEFWKDIKDGKTVTRIDKLSLLTGHDIWLRQTFSPIIDSEGILLKVLNIAADITETVEQKESLEKQSSEISRANIEMKSFSDAVDKALIKCVFSPAGQILELNEHFEHITGFTEKEMLGKNNRVFLQRVEKEQFDKIWEDMLKDKPYSGVIRRTKPTGEEVWIMSTFTPVKDENGNIFKVFLLGQDITERKLKYQLLEEANKEIDRLRKELDER